MRLAFVAFVLIVVGANLLTQEANSLWWPGVTAGTYLAGFAFVARDWLDSASGERRKITVPAAIATGSIVVALFDPGLALASVSAFVISELADWAVYSRLNRTRWAAIASNIVGAILDTIVFLAIASAFSLSPFITFGFGVIAYQVLVKVGVTTPVALMRKR